MGVPHLIGGLLVLSTAHAAYGACIFGNIQTLSGLGGKLSRPTDLEFNPLTKQLWITNADTDDFTIVHDAATNKQAVRKLRDRGQYHYMANVSGLAFTAEGNVATSQESLNDYLDPKRRISMMEPNYFMGPTLFNSSDAELITNDGQKCILGSERSCFLIHTDMLHEAPLATGITYNKGWQRDPHPTHKAGPNSFWYIDGMCDTLIMYDFATPHGPFSMDHSTARVHRYANINITRVQGVPSGADMDLSGKERVLYVADTGGKRVLKVFVDTSKRAFDARTNYTIFSSANKTSFDYYVYEDTKFEVFALVDMPSGIAVTDYYVFVNDFASGKLHAYDKRGNLVTETQVTQDKGLAGLTYHEGFLWMTNALTNSVMKLAPAASCDDEQKCTKCGQKNCMRCSIGDECSDNSDCASSTCSPSTKKCVFEPQTMSDAGCVKRGALTPVIKPEPEPGDDDYVAPEAGYADPDKAVAQKDDYADYTADQCDTLNFDALLLSGYLCHVCLPNPCDNGGACVNVPNLGYRCECGKTEFRGDQCQTPINTQAPISTLAPTTLQPTVAPTREQPRTESPTAFDNTVVSGSMRLRVAHLSIVAAAFFLCIKLYF